MAFSRSSKEIERALDRMVGLDQQKQQPPVVDNLFYMSKPITSNFYYCPSIHQLNALGADSSSL